MMRTKQDKTKVMVILAALCIVGIAALSGIALSLHKEKPVNTVAAEEMPEESMAVVTNDESQEPVNSSEQEADAAPVVVATTVEKEIKVDTSIGNKIPESSETVQEIQETPEKTEDKKPADPPTEKKKQEQTKQDKDPSDEDSPTTSSNGGGQHGQIKGGQIYIEGFGWVEYNGGGAEGTYVDGMSENGNKVGVMN